jgi:endo-1,4-beta-xylanase
MVETQASHGPRVGRWLLAAAAGAMLLVGLLAAVRAQPAAAAGTTLRAAADAKGIKIGSAFAANHLSADATYASIGAAQFNSVTPENEMKWGSVEPSQGNFNFGPADQVVAFAQANSMRIRGHNLVWQNQLPSFVNSTNFSTPDAVLNEMASHIATEVGRYKGEIAEWDVVNEPFNGDGSLVSDIFSQATPVNGAPGSGYIADALNDAHQADPAAKLFINDFNIETVNAKSNAMLSLVTSLKQQGVPIGGVGFESHFVLGQISSPTALEQNIARFTALGLSVEVTELDDRITLSNGVASAAQLAQQATEYASVVNACLAESGCTGITIWEYTDKYSWVPGTFSGQGAADIYDSNLQPKPSFDSVLTALGGSSPTPSMSPTSTATTSPTPSPTPSRTPTPTATPTATPTGSGGLSATAVVSSSSPYFNEEDVRLTSPGGVTSLTVTIVVQRTTGISFNGLYNTVGGQILQSDSSTASAVTYTFTLASGQTLGSGQFTFAAQTSGTGTVHPTSGDTFTVTSSAGSVSGHF